MALTRPRYSDIVDTDYKNSVRIVTTTNITLVGGAPLTYDSVTLSAGDRVLVSNQNTGTENGIYVVETPGTGSNGTWIRALDARTNDRVTAGLQTYVGEGTYAGQQWRLSTPDPIILGITVLNFYAVASSTPGGTNGALQFNTGGVFTGTTYLYYDSLTGNFVSSSLTDSISSTTGAVVVAGGLGIGGNINVGSRAGNSIVATGNINTTGSVSAAGFFWANGDPFLSSSYGNIDVAAYLLTNTGNIAAGNISVSSNIKAAGYFWANGDPFLSSSYSNVDVAAYLLTNTGNISAGNISTGNITASNVTTPIVRSLDNTGQLYLNNGGNLALDTSGNVNIFTGRNQGTYAFGVDFGFGDIKLTGDGGAGYLVFYNNQASDIRAHIHVGDIVTIDSHPPATVIGQYEAINNPSGFFDGQYGFKLDNDFGISGYPDGNIASIQIVDYRHWKFDNSGNIIFPDYTVQTTAYPGTATSLSDIDANIGVLYLGNISTQANLGAYQNYANANIGTITTNLQSLDANVGAYEQYADANIGTITTNLQSLDANVGAYEQYADANIGTISTNLQSLDANVGAYEQYANANIGTITTNLQSLDANVGAYEQYANANIGTITINVQTIDANLGSYQIWANANIGSNSETLMLLDANVAAYEQYANANIGTITTNVQTIDANVGIIVGNIQTLDANVGLLNINLQTLDANVGSSGDYANANVGTISINLQSLDANVGAYEQYANANIGAYQTYANLAFDSLATGANSNTAAYLTTYSGNIAANNIFVTSNVYINGERTLSAADLVTVTHVPVYITMNPTLVPVPLVGTSTTYGTYDFGSLSDITTYGDYDTVLQTGYYSVHDATGAPGHVEYIGFTGITEFNRVVLNINYTASSGHTQDIDLYNYTNDTWDTFGTYSGSGSWQNFVLGVIDSAPYISNTGNVTLRNYHVSSGNTSHRTWIDYVALEKSITGGQGPRGPTGATGASGTYSGGYISGSVTVGGNIVANSGTTSTSTTTGAIVAIGGVGVSGNVYTDKVYTTSGIYWSGNGTAFSSAPGGSSGAVQFNSSSTFGGATNLIYDSATGNTLITGGTSSTSETTGALVVNGGVGITGNLNIAGNLSITGTLTYINTTTEIVTGIEIVGGNLIANSGTASTSTTTGALIVRGGAGVSGNLWIGGNIKTTANTIGIGLNAGTNQAQLSVAIGACAGATAQKASAIAVGYQAGKTNQAAAAIAIGSTSGYSGQKCAAIAIGINAGQTTQGFCGIAIGGYAGNNTQGNYSIAIGPSAGRSTQKTYAIAIGVQAGYGNQGNNSIAIGLCAGFCGQKACSVAVGKSAGYNTQGCLATSLGPNAGQNFQGSQGVAVGYYSAHDNQGIGAIAVGSQTGQSSQGTYAVALGAQAGYSGQGKYSVAIGYQAGYQRSFCFQADYSVAIGYKAGYCSLLANTIVINASASALNPSTTGLFVNPIRNLSSGNVLYYDPVTKEITYTTAPATYGNANVAAYLPTYTGNISAGNITASANIKAAGYFWANGDPFSSSSYSNVDVAGYLLTNTGNIAAGNVSAAGYFWANGDPFSSSSYSNVDVAAYLPTYTGNISAGNVVISGNLFVTGNTTFANTTISYEIVTGTEVVAGNIVANSGTNSTSVDTGAIVAVGGIGVSGNIYAGALYTTTGIRWAANNKLLSATVAYTADVAPPFTGNIKGDQWYDTINDVLYEYISDGVSQYWVDVQSLGQVGNLTSMSDTTLQGNIVVGLNKVYNLGTAVGTLGNVYTSNVVVTSNVYASNLVVTSNVITSNISTTKGIYWSNSVPYGSQISTGATAPTNAFQGDYWYSTTNDVLYRYNYDGTNNYWVDVASPTVGAATFSSTLIAQDLLPGAGNTYNLGSSSLFFSNIFANTITAGGALTTTSVNPPVNPQPGDQWYKQDTDALYQYVNDGVNKYWVDIAGLAVFGANIFNSSVLTTDLLPSVANAYNLGSTVSMFANLYIGNSAVLNNETVGGNLTVTGNIVGGGVRSTSSLSSSPPTNPTVGDIWYQTNTDIRYRYTFDGTSRYWVDDSSFVTGATYFGGNIVATDLIPQTATAVRLGTESNPFTGVYGQTVYTNLIKNIPGQSYVSVGTPLQPDANLTYDIGTNTLQFGNIYAGNIFAGGARSTTAPLPPRNPSVGDVWYNSDTDVRYRYTFDGTNKYWVDTDSAAIGLYAYTSTVVSTDIVPTISNTYSLGSSINWFANLYAGNIISNGAGLTVNGLVVSGNNVTAYGNLTTNADLIVRGNITTSGLGILGNVILSSNVIQQSAYYESYSNVANSGGNLTCNFNLGTIFYVPSLTAAVTANFTNVNATSGTVTGATVIIDQGATAYTIANIQINGIQQPIKWVNAVVPGGFANNTDIISFSMIYLGSGNYRVLGQLSSYG